MATLIFSGKKLKAKINAIDSDNIKAFNALIEARGHIVTLDARPYVALLDDLQIFYTLQEDHPWARVANPGTDDESVKSTHATYRDACIARKISGGDVMKFCTDENGTRNLTTEF